MIPPRITNFLSAPLLTHLCFIRRNRLGRRLKSELLQFNILHIIFTIGPVIHFCWLLVFPCDHIKIAFIEKQFTDSQNRHVFIYPLTSPFIFQGWVEIEIKFTVFISGYVCFHRNSHNQLILAVAGCDSNSSITSRISMKSMPVSM